MGFFDFAQSKGDGLVFKEWTTKDTLEGPKGAGLGGNIDVLFKIGEEEKPTKAFAGQPLSEVAAQVGVAALIFSSSCPKNNTQWRPPTVYICTCHCVSACGR
jgi:hypothetical protein